MESYWDPPWKKTKVLSSNQHLHYNWQHFQNKSAPLHGVLAIQDLRNLVPADLLVLRVAGQTVEDESDAAGCGIVSFKHKRVHFCSDVFIWKALLILILNQERGQNVQTRYCMCQTAASAIMNTTATSTTRTGDHLYKQVLTSTNLKKVTSGLEKLEITQQPIHHSSFFL